MRAECNAHLKIGHRCDRSAGGTARRVIRVERVARLASVVCRELGSHRFTEHDGPGLSQALHTGGVFFGTVALVDGRAVFGRHVGGVNHVLDAHDHAVQWPVACCCIGQRCGLAGGIQIEMRPGAHSIITFLNTVDIGLEQL